MPEKSEEASREELRTFARAFTALYEAVDCLPQSSVGQGSRGHQSLRVLLYRSEHHPDVLVNLDAYFRGLIEDSEDGLGMGNLRMKRKQSQP